MVRILFGFLLWLTVVFAGPEDNKVSNGDSGKLCFNGKRDGSGACVCDLDHSGLIFCQSWVII